MHQSPLAGYSIFVILQNLVRAPGVEGWHAIDTLQNLSEFFGCALMLRGNFLDLTRFKPFRVIVSHWLPDRFSSDCHISHNYTRTNSKDFDRPIFSSLIFAQILNLTFNYPLTNLPTYPIPYHGNPPMTR